MASAATRLHLSQPAMSRTLGRIREATGDRILVRAGRTMISTPYALSVREQVHALVLEAHTVLAPRRELDLQTLHRTFSLRCHDAITNAIGSGLLARVHAQAPGVRLRMLAEGSVDTEELRRGQVDLEVGSTLPTLPDIRHKILSQHRLAVAVRADHPCTREPFTAERFAQGKHILMSRRGRLHDPVDDALEARNLRRIVLATAPTSAAVLQIVSETDLMAAVPEYMCQALICAFAIRLLPMPLELPTIPLILAWHQRHDNDKAQAWLRRQVAQVLRPRALPGDGGG